MGHKEAIHGWTDYPVIDAAGVKSSQWNKCKATSYDGNKYVTVVIYAKDGPVSDYIKAAHVRRAPRDSSPSIKADDLLRSPLCGGNPR